jgi:hypothetical protein
MKRIVIYHGPPCCDGFTAAWVAWLKYGDAATTYVPAQYGDAPPDVSGADVLILDFSYPRDALIAMHKQAASLLVIDHHRTALDALRGAPFARFDVDRSGAGLAWDHLHGGTRPLLVDYVEDRDLWRWRMPTSREINAWIGCQPHDFDTWTYLRDLIAISPKCAFDRGTGVVAVVGPYVLEQAKQAIIVTFEGHQVPVVNTTFAIDELLNHLATGAPFAIGWHQRKDGRYAYSLRSVGDFDVSEIARKHGGGGHKNAAGFDSAERIV